MYYPGFSEQICQSQLIKSFFKIFYHWLTMNIKSQKLIKLKALKIGKMQKIYIDEILWYWDHGFLGLMW